MALLVKSFARSSHCLEQGNIIRLCMRTVQTSSSRQMDQRWRQRRGLTANPNVYGPLTNLPDYSYKDGRPAPIGMRHKTRIEKQREYAAKILQLTEEVDFAVDRHERLQRETEERKQQILDRKLQPKGNLLTAKGVTVERK